MPDENTESPATLIEGFWREDRPPSLSVQVLQELYVNLVRKNVSAKAARRTVEDHLEWPVVDNDRDLLCSGLDECERWQLSTWDGLILAAARRAGARVLWSEDFISGQDYGGITVRNPFQESE